MKIDKKLLHYCVYAAVTVLFIYTGITVLNNSRTIFLFAVSILRYLMVLIKPLLIALVIAYLLKPGVQWIEKLLERKKIFKNESQRRNIGIVVTYAMVLAVFISVVYGIYVMVGGKLSNNTTIANISSYLSDYFKNSTLSVGAISSKLESLNISLLGTLNDKIAQIVSGVQAYFTTSIGGTTNFIASLGGNIVTFFIGSIISIYLIKDFEYFKALWNKIFYLIFKKSESGRKLTIVANIIDETFKKYLRGQLLEAAIVGTLSAIVLYIIRIDYALIIGVIAGICNMIPYVGPVVGTILAVIMALLSGQPSAALWAIVGMLAVQQLDNMLIAPKIVGDSVGLHPVFTMLAILIGGNAGGLLGMLTAVPIAASLKVMFSMWYAAHVPENVE